MGFGGAWEKIVVVGVAKCCGFGDPRSSADGARHSEVDPEIRTGGEVMKLWWLRVGEGNPNPYKPSESKTQKT